MLVPLVASGYFIQTVIWEGWMGWLVGTHLVAGLAYLIGVATHQVRALTRRMTPRNGSVRENVPSDLRGTRNATARASVNDPHLEPISVQAEMVLDETDQPVHGGIPSHRSSPPGSTVRTG